MAGRYYILKRVAFVLNGKGVAAMTALAFVLVSGLLSPDYCDVICSQPFLYVNLAQGLGFGGNNGWMLAEDFTPVDQGNINCYEIWAIYSGGNPTNIRIQMRSDASGPGSILTDLTTSEVSHINTGLFSWGYSLWYTEISPGVTFTANAGTKYWVCLQTEGVYTSYCLCANQCWADQCYFSSDDGATWTSSTNTWGTPYELFMILSDIVALERNSWGGIKVLFQ